MCLHQDRLLYFSFFYNYSNIKRHFNAMKIKLIRFLIFFVRFKLYILE